MGDMILIVGPPGTGKTTELTRLAKEAIEEDCKATDVAPEKSTAVLIATLTRSAASEARSRGIVLADGQIATLHSHCWRALGRPRLMVEADSRREWQEHCAANSVPLWRFSSNGRRSDPCDDSNRPLGDDLIEYYDLLRSKQDELPQDELLGEFIDRYESFKRINGIVDFHDCIQHCIDEEIDPPGDPRVILIDEAQDNDLLEVKLIKAWSNGPTVRITYIIGDPDQNLYEWRGSSPQWLLDSQNFKRELQQYSTFRLRKNPYRLGMRIRERIKVKIPTVKFTPVQEDGTTSTTDLCMDKMADAQMLLDMVNDRYLRGGRSAMFLASARYQLRSIICALRDAGISYWNRYAGEDAYFNPYTPAHGISVLDRLRAFVRPSDEGERLWTWQEAAWILKWLVATESGPGSKRRILQRGAKKRCETIAASSLAADPLTPDEMRGLFASQDVVNEIASGFRPKVFLRWCMQRHRPILQAAVAIYNRVGFHGLTTPPQVTVGTIHSVKGGEADTVILCPSLAPKFWETYEGEDADQIHRMMYVAVTRARYSVVITGDERHNYFDG